MRIEFLVEIEVSLPPQLGDDERAALAAAEARRGRELQEAGTIVRIWRVPGRTANVGIWRASDPTELHEALVSLPMFPYLRADVTALATHGLEARGPR